MANTIKLKQGSGSNPSSSDLVVGEVALRTDGNPKLFTKNDAGNVLEVGLDSLNAKLPLAGGTLTGNLTLNTIQPRIRLNDSNDNPDYSILNEDGIFGIYDDTNSSHRLTISSSAVDINVNLDANAGLDVTGDLTVSQDVSIARHLDLADDSQLRFGSPNGFNVYHDGSNTYMINQQGNLYIREDSGNIHIQGRTNKESIIAKYDAEVELYFNDNLRFETSNDGATITGRLTPAANNTYGLGTSSLRFANFFSVTGNFSGTLTATTFSGSGASLTNIPAGQLTGTLPALDGSNLTGLTVNNANTLDNLDSTQFLRSDAADSFSNVITGNTLLLGGGQIIGSSAVLQVNGFVRTGSIYLHRGTDPADGVNDSLVLENDTGVLKWNSNTIFHTANDGSGSGLDSDTLDGVQGSSFLRSDAADSISGTITFTSGGLNLSTNDIYLDARVIQNASGGTDDGLYIGYNNANSGVTRIYGGGTTSGGLVVTGNGANNLIFNSNTVFHSGNDGSGSGLDSDTLDGIQATSFLRSDANDTASGQITLTSSTQYPLNINSSADGKIVLQGSSNPFIRFQEGTTNKAYIQWNASGWLQLSNSEDQSGIRIKDDIRFTQDNFSSSHKIWHGVNDGSGSNLDADTVDGVQASDLVAVGGDTMTGNLRIDQGSTVDGIVGLAYNTYFGLKHADQTLNSEYMILSKDFDTFISATSGYKVRIRAGGNDQTNELNIGSGNDALTWRGNKVFHAGNDGSGSNLDADTLDGQHGSHYTNAGNLNAGTIPAARIGSTSAAELGISATGNFGQWQPHGTYTDFNSEPAYWGWNYVMGNTNAPNTASTQWYRGRFSLGDAYGKGSDANDYSMEITVPRATPFDSGSMYVRIIENGGEGSWAEVGTRPYNSILPVQTSVALGSTTSRFANVYSQELNITKASGNLSAIIQADSGLGTIEVAGSSGAFIDIKTPSSDDFDLRLGASGSVGYAASAGNYYISANNKNVLYATADNSTELFYNGSHRLATRDAGLDLLKAGEYFLKLVNTSNGQSDGTYVSSLIGMGKDDANNFTEYTKMITQIVDASNGTEDGRLIMQSMKDGSMTTAATVEAGYFQRNNAPGVSGDNFNWTNSLKYMHSGGLRFNTGDWNNSTGTFTCPVAGHYLCMATVQGHRANDETGASDQYFNVLWQKNNINQFSESVATQHPDGQSTGNTTATHYTVSQCVIIQCSVGDTLRAYSNHGYRRAVQNQLSIMLLA